MNFFTSDSHFYGEKVIKREKRPFQSKEYMNEYMIEMWNRQAKKGDTIYHLGDFLNYASDEADYWQQGIDIVNKLNADVILIIGNNEERVIKKYFNDDFEKFREYAIEHGFKDVKKDAELVIDGKEYFLNHYPSRYKKNKVNLFGHIHRITGMYKPFGYNVGVDLNYFLLYSEIDIVDIDKQKDEFWLNDADVNAY